MFLLPGLGACADAWLHDPASATGADVRLAFQQVGGGASGAFDAADNLAVEVTAGGVTLFSGTVDAAAGGGPIESALRVDLPDGAVRARIGVDVRRGSDPLFTGSTDVDLEPGESVRAEILLTAVVAGLDLTPPPTFTAWGQSAELQGSAVFATGHAVPGGQVTWESLAPQVVRVEATGSGYRAVAVSDGSASLRGSFQGRTATVAAQVDAVVTSVEVQPSAVSLGVGETTQMTAVLRDANGNVLPNRAPTWSSSDETVASVSSGGVVTGVAEGEAEITASRDGASAGASVSVRPPGPVVTTLDPISVTFDGANLRALVDPGGAETAVVFEYGPDPALAEPARTGAIVVPASSAPVVVSRSVIGLPDDATLYVRAVGSNAFGTSRGDIVSFRTLPAPPAAPSGLAGAYTGTVRITWIDNSENEVRFELERELIQGSGAPGAAPSGPLKVFQPLGSVPGNVTVFDDPSPPTGELRYRVRACSATACSSWSPALTWFYGLPPRVQTRSVAFGSDAEAILSAFVNPLDAPTTVVWEISESPSFVSPPPIVLPTAPLDAGVGHVDVIRSYAWTSYQYTVYYVRAVATNPWGTTVGNVVILDTSGIG